MRILKSVVYYGKWNTKKYQHICKHFLGSVGASVMINYFLLFPAYGMETPEDLVGGNRPAAKVVQDDEDDKIPHPEYFMLGIEEKNRGLSTLANISYNLASAEKKKEETNTDFRSSSNTTRVKLVKKALVNEKTQAEKDGYQFVDMNDQPLRHRNGKEPYYDEKTLLSRLCSTETIYTNAIQQLQEKAYRSLKPLLSAEHIDERIIKSLLENYLDELNTEAEINITGSSLSANEIEDLNHHMNLCHAIYTDWSTRNDAPQHLELVEKQWNDIIQIKNNLERHRKNFEEVCKKNDDIIHLPTTFNAGGSKIKRAKQVPAQDTENQIEHNKEVYAQYLKSANEYLEGIGKAPINDKTPDVAKKTLENILHEINSKYFWIFDKNTEDIKTWMQAVDEKLQSLVGKHEQPLPTFKDIDDEKHQLTAKAVIASSFLSKAGLLSNENITVIDVGFRNQERFGSSWNEFMTKFAKSAGKSNPQAWFLNKGEVDYIAYLEKDPGQTGKDKLVIVYSGSNSAIDWGINLTFGYGNYDGISVHDGIGWLFETSRKTSHNILIERIKQYYNHCRKPEELEIITTGHSLGAGLAGLAAFHYKKNVGKFREIIAPQKISVKTFTFAAPAIIHEKSKEVIEGKLGRNNIYRAWVDKDPVVLWTDGAAFQHGVHIGKNIPLYNIQNLPANSMDLWKPHLAESYEGALSFLKSENYEAEHKNFLAILNNYIKTTHLDIYKTNLRKLKEVREVVKEYHPETFEIPEDLARHLLTYSSTTFNFKLPMTVQEISPHSPRYAAALSPRFTAENSKDLNKIKATFIVEGELIDFFINKHTDCSVSSLQAFLHEKKGINLDEDSAEKISCGCYYAKHIFLPHTQKYTLTELQSKCLEGKSGSVDYIRKIAEGKNSIEQATTILEAVGLGEEFKNKKISFSRGKSDKRPGIDIAAQYKKAAPALHINTLKRLMVSSSKESIKFDRSDLTTSDYTLRKIINSTSEEDHYNQFTDFLKIADLSDLLAEYDIDEKEKKLTEFIRNFIDMLDVFDTQSYQAHSFFLKPKTIHQKNIREDLERIKMHIIFNIWNLKK